MSSPIPGDGSPVVGSGFSAAGTHVHGGNLHHVPTGIGGDAPRVPQDAQPHQNEGRQLKDLPVIRHLVRAGEWLIHAVERLFQSILQRLGLRDAPPADAGTPVAQPQAAPDPIAVRIPEEDVVAEESEASDGEEDAGASVAQLQAVPVDTEVQAEEVAEPQAAPADADAPSAQPQAAPEGEGDTTETTAVEGVVPGAGDGMVDTLLEEDVTATGGTGATAEPAAAGAGGGSSVPSDTEDAFAVLREGDATVLQVLKAAYILCKNPEVMENKDFRQEIGTRLAGFDGKNVIGRIKVQIWVANGAGDAKDLDLLREGKGLTAENVLNAIKDTVNAQERFERLGLHKRGSTESSGRRGSDASGESSSHSGGSGKSFRGKARRPASDKPEGPGSPRRAQHRGTHTPHRKKKHK